jgi:putative peptidoglycan binding protein/helix-turn-helix protein
VRLRRLKDHGGLSTRQLAAKTGYSAKSWERYLGGRSLPPAGAVEAMARVAGEDPTRLLALHEIAAEAWDERSPGTSVPHGPTEQPVETGTACPPSVPGPQPLHRRPLLLALVAGAVVAAMCFSVLLAVRLPEGERPRAAGPNASSARSASRPPATHACDIERIDGLWYAGHSRTRNTLVGHGHAGPQVTEAQCLLRRAGVDPGKIDGIFGPLTQRAVRQVQRQAEVPADGIIGVHTWKILRGGTLG